MHPSILGAGLCALACSAAVAAAPAKPAPRCPGPQAAVQERLLPADCADCWSAATDRAGSAAPAAQAWPGWRFDWIVPAGDAAPLAAGALPESAERAQRLGLPLPPGQTAQAPQRTGAAPPLAGLRLAMASGPAWQGYFGVQLSLRSSPGKPLPAGSSAWLALVEQVPAGSDGTPVARALVRSVAGPLPLDGLPPGRTTTHLRALRWPASAEPTRLQARAWIEAPDGQILAVAADRCSGR